MVDVRITSTYVENTYTMGPRKTSHQDHLHIRGEYAIISRLYANLLGSPPHTWRIQCQNLALNASLGITSTYVENTVLLYHLYQ